MTISVSARGTCCISARTHPATLIEGARADLGEAAEDTAQHSESFV
jgi:hypothetical protein